VGKIDQHKRSPSTCAASVLRHFGADHSGPVAIDRTQRYDCDRATDTNRDARLANFYERYTYRADTGDLTMGSSQISLQKLLSASQGNTDLLEVLTQIQQGASQQAAVTGTTPIAGQTPGLPNAAAPVPPQATGVVSILGGSYIVQITNPGALSPISALQAAQAGNNATNLTPLQPVTPIYHQIRASTSPAFNVNSNTQTFGGNTGSTQTYWTLTGLGTGTWYIQFRSSYDGVNFNTWRNANGGTALGGLINEVTEENAGNANWALFTLPGSLVMGVGEGYCTDGEIFDLAEQLYSSGMFAIAGPNGYVMKNFNSTFGVIHCDVDLQVPNPLPVSGGIPDYPAILAMEYGQQTNSAIEWPGSATVFALAVDPSNDGVKLYVDPAGAATWATMKLPGGAHIAIGQGKNNDGDTLWIPALPWLNASRMMSISSFTDAVDIGFGPDGFYANEITAGVLAAKYHDTNGDIWGTTANWLAIAWEIGTDVQTISGAPWLTIQLQGGHAVVIGAGSCTNGSSVTLPTGYTEENLLSVVVPNGGIVNPNQHNLCGIAQCSMVGLTPFLAYQDSSWNTWPGNTNFMICAWK